MGMIILSAAIRPASLESPFVAGDVLEPGGHQHERGLAAQEHAADPRFASDLAIESLDDVVRLYSPKRSLRR